MRDSWSLALIFVVTLNTAVSQACLKQALSRFNLPASFSGAGAVATYVVGSPLVWIAATLQVVGFALWMVVVSREKLAVAVAISGAIFYLLMATIGWILFSEKISLLQGFGLGLISLGVMLVALPR